MLQIVITGQNQMYSLASQLKMSSIIRKGAAVQDRITLFATKPDIM